MAKFFNNKASSHIYTDSSIILNVSLPKRWIDTVLKT